MNYFELINKTLIELNYQPVSTFDELTKIEHKRLMNIFNRLNKEICNLDDKFQFRQMIKNVNLSSDKKEYSISISGKIEKVVGNDIVYNFEPDYTKFYMIACPKNSYGFYGEKFLFSPQNDKIKIFYSTDMFVKGNENILKNDFEKATDESIIPENFVEKLFINGGAYNFKQDTSHPKYVHWKTEYDKALNELLSSSKKVSNSNIKIDGGYRKL
ncbi:MAG: hypothetical protein MJ180_00560 [Candidatus Gastranaerophilales bacterium]|nr:hypothetical protein [Candidatus Gastranaerophilales bacterium]